MAAEALARHLVRDRIGGAVLAPGTLEDLGEAYRDRVDVRNHLLLGGAAAVLARDADDAARVDDVVRSIQDAGALGSPWPSWPCASWLLAAPATMRARNRGIDCVVSTAPERAGGEHVDVLEQHVLDRHRVRPELIAHALQCGGSHVRGAQPRAGGGEQAAQVIADAAHALDGHRDARKIGCAPGETSPPP